MECHSQEQGRCTPHVCHAAAAPCAAAGACSAHAFRPAAFAHHTPHGLLKTARARTLAPSLRPFGSLLWVPVHRALAI